MNKLVWSDGVNWWLTGLAILGSLIPATTSHIARAFDLSADSILAQNTQTSRISVDARDLSYPHVLSISTNGQLSGRVIVNGVIVQNLLGRSRSINLSPYLRRNGRTTVRVIGSYVPRSAAVTISFTGPGTQTTQQMSGAGALAQTLIVDVY